MYPFPHALFDQDPKSELSFEQEYTPWIFCASSILFIIPLLFSLPFLLSCAILYPFLQDDVRRSQLAHVSVNDGVFFSSSFLLFSLPPIALILEPEAVGGDILHGWCLGWW